MNDRDRLRPNRMRVGEGSPGSIIRILVIAEHFLASILRASMIIAGLLLAFIMVIQIVLRYWIEAPFLGIEEVSVLFGLWLYFLSAAYVTREDSHIKGGIAELLIKNTRSRAGLRLAGTIICLLASIVFAYFAGKYALFTYSTTRASTYLGWHTGIWVTSMVIGFGLMVFYFLVQAILQWWTWSETTNDGD